MKKLYVCLLALLSTLFCACDAVTTSPEDYQAEIEDFVKFSIAEADYLIEGSQKLMEVYDWVDSDWGEWVGLDSAFESKFEEYVDAMADYFLDLYNGNEWSFEEMLKHVSENGSTEDSPYVNDAKAILKNYQKLSISLTDYEPVSTRSDYKSYAFKELHSGIEFVFELMDLDTDQPKWSCMPLDSSMESYVLRKSL